jgi:glutamine cyclotransferase
MTTEPGAPHLASEMWENASTSARTPCAIVKTMRLLIALFLTLLPAATQAATPVYGYKVVATFPHSTTAYTEGFFYLDGLFYEGTGMKARSQVLALDPATGRTLQHTEIAPDLFGEGIVDWGSYLYEWTWTSHICFVYDRFSLRPIKQLTYTGEGWGMTRTAKEIVTSDGTATLRFRKPETFAETRHILVHDGARAVDQLNELEYIDGEIYANVWHSDRIARISPADGHLIAWIDLKGILPDSERVDSESVLNGIAWDAKGKRLFVTGKQWPKIFQIELTPPR